MKNRVLYFIAIVAFSAALNAGTGKAISPAWYKSEWNRTQIYVSNVSPSSTTVYITFYDKNGNVYDESSETGTQFSYDGFSALPIATAGGVLQGNSSGYVMITNVGGTQFGYAVIEWASSDNKSISLVAYSYQTMFDHEDDDTYGRNAIPINSGNPF